MVEFKASLPEWNNKGVEPPKAKKDAGWKADERPPAAYINWLQSQTFDARVHLERGAQLDRIEP